MQESGAQGTSGSDHYLRINRTPNSFHMRVVGGGIDSPIWPRACILHPNTLHLFVSFFFPMVRNTILTFFLDTTIVSLLFGEMFDVSICSTCECAQASASRGAVHRTTEIL